MNSSDPEVIPANKVTSLRSAVMRAGDAIVAVIDIYEWASSKIPERKGGTSTRHAVIRRMNGLAQIG